MFGALINAIPVDLDGNYDPNGDDVAMRTSQLYKEGSWEEVEPFVYFGEMTQAPADLPALEIDQNYVHPGTLAVCFAFASIGMLMALVFAAWTAHERKSFVVKASQPIFMGLICLGSLILASSIIPLGIDPGLMSVEASSRACVSDHFTACFSLCV
jgi:hypothetical protein